MHPLLKKRASGRTPLLKKRNPPFHHNHDFNGQNIVSKTPLMEFIFTYILEQHLIHLKFKYHDKRSIGSQFRRHGAHVLIIQRRMHKLD